jgi:hypothetical protein
MAVALNDEVRANGLAIAELRGLPPVVAALQSTFSGWIAGVIGVGAILLTGVAIIAAFQVFNGQGIKDQSVSISAQAIRLERVDATTQALAAKVDGASKDLAILVDREQRPKGK